MKTVSNVWEIGKNVYKYTLFWLFDPEDSVLELKVGGQKGSAHRVVQNCLLPQHATMYHSLCN